MKKLENLQKYLSSKIQTITYFGLSHKKIFDIVKLSNSNGVDRIVPFGNAHKIDQFWDGYDLFLSMTRVINHY